MCCILIAIVVVTFSQVVFRYVLESPLSWSDEGARFLLMWLAMLSAAYAFKTRSHFALVFIVNRFEGRLRWTTSLFVVAAVSLFLAVFIVKAVEYTLSVMDVTGPGTQLSMAVPYSSTIVGGVMMLYYVLRNGWGDLRRGPSSSG
jgi:TRAP-type C4-dicarboxylate transport system permease small subunit